MNATHPSSPSSAAPDALRAWTTHHRARFDTLEAPADLWAAIDAQLAAPDALRAWTQHHRAAFDTAPGTLEPRASAWSSIEAQLDAAPAARPALTASRGGAEAARSATRPAWWQLAAAAVVVFGLGYSLRVGTEAAGPAAVAVEQPLTSVADADADAGLHVAAPRHGFRNQEPDPAMQAAVLASHLEPSLSAEADAVDDDRRARARSAALAPEVARLEARYAALIVRQRAAAQHRFVPTRTLADEWDREMTVLDSAYTALRQELTHNARPDEVIAALDRNLHLRLKLLQQQSMALDAARQVRQHTGGRVVPHRPPSVNPDDNGTNFFDDAHGGGGTLVPPAPPAPEPLPGLGAGLTARHPRRNA